MTFNVRELDLLIEALSKAASRHESQAAFNPAGKNAREHDEKAAGMRKLRTRLVRKKNDLEAMIRYTQKLPPRRHHENL
jgi:hypothetical protein